MPEYTMYFWVWYALKYFAEELGNRSTVCSEAAGTERATIVTPETYDAAHVTNGTRAEAAVSPLHGCPQSSSAPSARTYLPTFPRPPPCSAHTPPSILSENGIKLQSFTMRHDVCIASLINQCFLTILFKLAADSQHLSSWCVQKRIVSDGHTWCVAELE